VKEVEEGEMRFQEIEQVAGLATEVIIKLTKLVGDSTMSCKAPLDKMLTLIAQAGLKRLELPSSGSIEDFLRATPWFLPDVAEDYVGRCADTRRDYHSSRDESRGEVTSITGKCSAIIYAEFINRVHHGKFKAFRLFKILALLTEIAVTARNSGAGHGVAVEEF
jgi:hypothetical protein